MGSTTVLVLCILLIQGSLVLSQECKSSADCGNNECCAVGMQRFSIPQCMKMGKKHDYCRVENQPEDRELYYPNQEIKRVFGSYSLFCPCSEGLFCKYGKCQKGDGVTSNDK